MIRIDHGAIVVYRYDSLLKLHSLMRDSPSLVVSYRTQYAVNVMAKRKTFEVEAFRQYVNNLLLTDVFDASAKDGLCTALDHVLHETGNYKGFRYIYKDAERPCTDVLVNDEFINPNWTSEHEMRREYF